MESDESAGGAAQLVVPQCALRLRSRQQCAHAKRHLTPSLALGGVRSSTGDC